MAISSGSLLFAEDIERIQRKLSALPDVMANKIMRKALRDGAKIALAEYENNLTRMQDTGAMLASTRIAPLKRNRRGRLNVGVQIVTDATTHDRPEVKHYGQDFPYPFMVEFGHRIGKRSDALATLSKTKSRRGRQLKDTYRGTVAEYFRRSKKIDDWQASSTQGPPEIVRVRRFARQFQDIEHVRKWIRSDLSELKDKISKMDKRKEVLGKYPMRRAFDSTKDVVRGAIHNSINQAMRNIARLTAAEAGVG